MRPCKISCRISIPHYEPSDLAFPAVLKLDVSLQVVKGIVEGCNQSDCILLGGEVSLGACCLMGVESHAACMLPFLVLMSSRSLA